ncbi:MAG: putative toxin-antitoxin system toxin component, PIN family [Vulcanimicrobiaceae bacterium]
MDPGVLIAGLISADGAPRALLLRWLGGDFELIVCPALLAELESVLLRPKFRGCATDEEVRDYVDLVRRLATVAPDPPARPGLTPDPKDDYLVALARASRVGILVSGDRHLLDLREAGLPVLTPRAFVDELV